MSEQTEKLKLKIAELERKADEAYRRRDYVAEKEYDAILHAAHRAPCVSILFYGRLIPIMRGQIGLRQGLLRLKIFEQFLQFPTLRYFREGMASLGQWPDAEKRTRQFNENMRRYSCKSV